MFGMTPIAGDPARVRSEGQRLVAAADNMRKAAASLRRMNDGATYSSDAIDAVRRNAEDLATVMDDSQGRFRGAGQALVEYAPKLDAAQHKAAQAMNANGHTDVVGATAKVAAAKVVTTTSMANPLASPEEKAADQLAYRRAQARMAEQVAAAGAARRQYDEARAELEAAALAAMQRINAANRRSKLNDSIGDHLKNFKDRFLAPTLEAIRTVLSTVADILTVVGIIAAFVPGLQPLAAALVAVGTIIKVVSLITMVLQFLVGDMSLGDFAAAMLFVVAGALIAKVGKVLQGKQPTPAPDWVEGMGVKDGARYSLERFKYGSMNWEQGGKAVLKVTVDKGKDAVEGDRQGWLAGQIDSMVDPSDVWSTDDLASNDVAPVEADLSSVDPDDIVSRSFGSRDVGDAPVVAGAVR